MCHGTRRGESDKNGERRMCGREIHRVPKKQRIIKRGIEGGLEERGVDEKGMFAGGCISCLRVQSNN